MSEKKAIHCEGQEWEVTLSDPLGHHSSLVGNLPEPNEKALRFTRGSEQHVMRVGLDETLDGFKNLCELLRVLRGRGRVSGGDLLG
jgi:hypothetical protein